MSSYLRGLLPSSCLVLLVGCSGGGGGSAPAPSPPPPTDTTAPDTNLTATPPTLANSSNATFTASTEAGATLQASLDGAAYATVTATFTLSNVADGAHTLNVRARDAAGNLDATPATYSWTVDTQAADTTIATSPAAHTNATNASFTFTSEAGATFQVSLDGAAYAAATSPYTSGTLPDGLHTFDVRAVDAAGNADTTPASFAWTVDATGPVVQILFPTAVSYSDASEIHVRGTVNDLHGITSVSVNGVAANGGIGVAHWNALVPISAGNNTITVSATDAVGNVGTASAIVANRGPVQYAVYRVAWDGARNRALLTGIPDDTLFAARESDGHLSVVSGPSRGTGPALTSIRALVMDAPGNRVFAINAVDVIEIDLESGNRTLIPTAAPTTDTTPAGQMVCNSPCTRLYGYTMFNLSGPSAAFSIDLATGARTVISGMFGSGPVIVDGQGIVLDGSTGTPRLLIPDTNHRAILDVNIATGDRTYMSHAQVGSGPTLTRPGGAMLDAANNRLLVFDQATSFDCRLFAIDLATGNRSLLAGGSNSSLGVTFGQTLDSANTRLLLAQYQPARVSQLNLGTGQVTRFSDGNVGTGPSIVGGSLLLDGPNGNRSLLTSAYNAVVRVNLATGARTAVVPANFPNSTTPFPPRYLAFDTRPGALPGQVLFSPGSSSNETFLFSGNLINGTSSRITTAAPVPYGSWAEFPLDAPNGRLIVNYPPSFGQSRIAPLDVTSGTLGPALADSTIGTPSFSTLSAMALDNVPGGTTRLLAVDNSGVFAVDLATGTRSVVSSTTVGGGTAPVAAYGLAVDSATRRAWAVSGSDGAVQWIDLVNGNRAIISGRIPGTQILVGTGPRIQGDFPRIVVDLAADVAYVTSNADNVLAVDLVLGDRVITAR